MVNINEARKYLVDNGWDAAFVFGLDADLLVECYLIALEDKRRKNA